MTLRLFPRRGAPAAIARKTTAPRTTFGPMWRGHSAASASSLLADWYGTRASANGITAREGERLRHRARELRENSSIVARYAYLVRTNVIGPDGITLSAYVPSTRGKNVQASAEVEAGWYGWATSVTPDGRSLVDALGQLVETWKVEGEALATVTTRGDTLQITPVDPDLLDQHYSETRRNGHEIEQGIECDAAGRVVGYWLWDASEDDSARRSRRFWRAEDVLHLPHRTRPNQRRGVTALAPVMVLLQHLDKLDEALVVLNRTAASKMFQYVAQGEWAPPLVDGDGKALDPEVHREEVAPGNQWIPPYGYEAKTIDPGQPTGDLANYVGEWLRRVASGLNVAESSLTGDLSRANYGSQRGGMIHERDGWKMDQALVIDRLARPLFARWLRHAVLTRTITLPAGVTLASVIERSEWFPRRWSWIDPLKDAQAIETMLRLRLTSRTRELNQLGIDVRALFQEIADESALADELNITLPDDAVVPPADDEPTDATLPSRALRAVS